LVGLAGGGIGPVAHAEDAPQTRPVDQRRGPGPGMMINRLSENLGKLGLSPEQQEKTDALLEDTKKQLMEIRDQLPPDADKRVAGEKMREVFGAARQKLQDILTPDQQEKLRDITQQQLTERAAQQGNANPPPIAPPPAPAERPKVDEVPKANPTAKNPPQDDMMKPGPGKTAPAAKPKDDVPSATTVEPGQPAPAFTLKPLSGQPVSLAAMKGRVVVVVFGSYSTPSFRQRVPALEKLAKDYATRVAVLVVYTREAHAVGEWEVDRNKDENIAVEQPKSEADRKALATLAVNTLKVTVPVLLDEMDNSTAKAYGLTPNGAVVINRDGTVAARQHWFEPIGLRQQIDAAISVRNVKE